MRCVTRYNCPCWRYSLDNSAITTTINTTVGILDPNLPIDCTALWNYETGKCSLLINIFIVR